MDPPNTLVTAFTRGITFIIPTTAEVYVRLKFMNSDLLKIFSLNTRSLNDYNRQITLYDWLEVLYVDIVLLQETHFIEPKEHVYKDRWRRHNFHCFLSSSTSWGVSILIRNGFPYDLINYNISADGRKILLNVKIKDKIYSIVNINAPNKFFDRKAVFYIY